MDDTKTLLRNYLDALAEPTRANLLLELEAAGELTATQLARRLGLSVNNVYHHIRVLNRLGVLAKPRIVPGATFVEKYYKVLPAITGALDHGWYDETSKELPVAERQMRWSVFCAQVGQLLLRAADRYAAMTPEEWQRTVLSEQSGMISLRLLDQERYLADLAKLREVVNEPSHGVEDSQQVMIIAALPELMRLRQGVGPQGTDSERPLPSSGTTARRSQRSRTGE